MNLVLRTSPELTLYMARGGCLRGRCRLRIGPRRPHLNQTRVGLPGGSRSEVRDRGRDWRSDPQGGHRTRLCATAASASGGSAQPAAQGRAARGPCRAPTVSPAGRGTGRLRVLSLRRRLLARAGPAELQRPRRAVFGPCRAARRRQAEHPANKAEHWHGACTRTPHHDNDASASARPPWCEQAPLACCTAQRPKRQ
jgi:hypothetical protein